ncbi:Solute carrier family 2, partial [Acropora cervicornis]
MDSSRFDCQAGEYYIGGRETRSLLEAENSDHIGDHKVEEMQLVQPQFQETPCCPQMPWLYLVMAAVMAALGGVLFGYDIGIVSGAILQLRLTFELNCIKQEMVVSSMLMGAVVASLTGGFIVDFIGRRMAIIINAAIFLAGAVILACAPSFPVLVLGRFVVGFGVSLSAIAECIYISEIAPPDRRGLLVSFNEVGICVGILLAYSACRIIQKLGLSRDSNEELAKIKSGLNVEYHYKFGDLFSTTDNMRKRMLVGGGVVFFQQFTGQPTIVYYASTIFQALGFQSSEKATLASLGIGLAKIFCTVISLSTVDKGGRRRFLLIGVSCMAVSVLTLGIVAHYTSLGHAERKCHFTPHTSQVSSTTTNSTSFSFVSLSSVNTTDPTPALASKGLRYFTLSALVLFVVSWLLLSEIFPAGIKGRAFSIATVLNWGTNLVVSFTFLDMLIICIVGLIFIYKYVPETKNRSLEQISAEFNT